MTFHAAEFRLHRSCMLADVGANDLRSLGRLCADLRVPYHVLADAVETLGITPSLVLNRVGYFDAKAVERLTAATATAAATTPPVSPASHAAASCAPDPADVPTPSVSAPRGRRRRREEKPHDRLSPPPEGARSR